MDDSRHFVILEDDSSYRPIYIGHRYKTSRGYPRWPDILPKDTLPKHSLPKDILPKDILPNGPFADGRFAERTFCRTDSLTGL